ncbi:MAG: hypothetical protein CMJ95_01135 [Planctomycetes bacterium]|nr:hypothetical protein [Planctomycetota bacterium]
MLSDLIQFVLLSAWIWKMKTWSGSVFGVPLFSLLRCIFNFKIAAFATGGGARVLSVCIAGVAIWLFCFVYLWAIQCIRV